MIQLRTLILWILVSIIGFIFPACDRRNCDEVLCNVNQICISGVCQCAAGYDEPDCIILSRDKLLGNYMALESCRQGTSLGGNFITTLLPSSRFNQVEMTNFIGSGLSVILNIDGNFITIPDQRVGAIQVVGQGNFIPATRQIRLEYQYSRQGEAAVCTAQMLRQ